MLVAPVVEARQVVLHLLRMRTIPMAILTSQAVTPRVVARVVVLRQHFKRQGQKQTME